MTFKIMGRLRKKYGSKLEDFTTNQEIASKIPDRWEFISKLDIPKDIRERYSMLYNITLQPFM